VYQLLAEERKWAQQGSEREWERGVGKDVREKLETAGTPISKESGERSNPKGQEVGREGATRLTRRHMMAEGGVPGGLARRRRCGGEGNEILFQKNT